MSLSQQNLAELIAAILLAIMSSIGQQQTQTQIQTQTQPPPLPQSQQVPNLTTALGFVNPSVSIIQSYSYISRILYTNKYM